MKRTYCILLLLIGSVASSYAQVNDSMNQSINTDTTKNETYDGDYKNINLPPISVFLETAKSYSDVMFYEQKTKEAEYLLKAAKKEWLKYFRAQGNYQYGTNNSFVSQLTGEPLPEYSSTTRQVQSWYNGGVVVSIPFDDLFSRKNKTNAAKARLNQATYEAERAIENRQILILETYNEVIKNIALMKVKAEAVALYNAQMQISERDFVNGRINIIDLSLERSRRADAIIKYEESKASLHNAVTILELLTKIKIIRNKE
ncbi:MAG: TolC family protein [Rikenellaceae bacterium]